MPTTRSREDLEAQCEAVGYDLVWPGNSPDTIANLQGAATALAWVLGQADIAPITATAIPRPTPVQVLAEHAAAEDVLYLRRASGRPRAWVTGVEHALLWAAAGTPNPPTSGPPTLQTAAAVADEMVEVHDLLDSGRIIDPDVCDRIAGALAVLGWVAGNITTAPVSRRVADQAPGVDSVENEATVARTFRRRSAQLDATWGYLLGADQALAWVLRRRERSVL